MADALIKACLQEGFVACDVYEEKGESRDFLFSSGSLRCHSGIWDRLAMRAFWERGEPVGFSISMPSVREVRRVLSGFKSAFHPGRGENYSELLPGVIDSGGLSIFDSDFNKVGEPAFADIREAVGDALVNFPGLKVRSCRFSTQQKRVFLANSFEACGRYSKTSFTLQFDLLWKDHRLEIGETQVFFRQLNPERLIVRAFNLLQSIVKKENDGEGERFLILSPEAAAAVILEYGNHFKIGGPTPRPHELMGASAVTLIDNPRMDGQAGSVPFDDEGVGAREKKIINKGVFVAPISDIKTAHAGKKASTGNGFREENGIFPAVQFSNLYLKPSPFYLSQLMRDAGRGILISMIQLKEGRSSPSEKVFSAYGFRFRGEEICEPVHVYLKTTFRSFWSHVRQVSKELRFFYRRFNIGSPYVLLEGKPDTGGFLSI